MQRLRITRYLKGGSHDPVTVDASCDVCIFWERKSDYGEGTPCNRGDCHRYPRPDNKNEKDWCGEFLPDKEEV